MNGVNPGKPEQLEGGRRAQVDLMRVLDRIAAALAALDTARTPDRRLPPAPQLQETAPKRPIRLRHNWG